MKLICIRHGESTYNVRGLCNQDPAVEVPLTPRGIDQATAAGVHLAAWPIDAIYASQMPRALQTAQIINAQLQMPLHVDARLNDRKNGFEGRPVSDYLAAAAADPVNFQPAGGETRLALKARVAGFLNDLRVRDHVCTLVVSHHEVLQIINGLLLGLDDLTMWRTWIENGQLLEYVFD